MMKAEELPPFNFPIEDKSERIIKVIGVGGGGGNAVQHMWEEGVKNVSFVVTNTDSQVLKVNMVPSKVQLGDGLGTGGDPKKGQEIAEKNIETIKTMFGEDTRMVFITAGMGGGTGTGAAPVIARVAKEMGILTVGVVTLPFKMEMRKRMDKALLGMEALKKNVDSLIVINNQKLLESEQYKRLTLEEGLKKADEVLTVATRTIAEIITVRGSINRDYNDVSTVMKDGGAALVSVAKASGEKRIFKALSEAISSPLVANVEKQKVRRLLYIVYSGEQNPARMDELEEISEFMENFDENLDVLWGHYPDDTLGDEIKVAVVATGFDQSDERLTQEDTTKQDEMKRLKDLREKFYSYTNVVPKQEDNPDEIKVEPSEEMEGEEMSEIPAQDVDEVDEPSKTPSFLDVLIKKLKVLMEEE
ncbi:MAG: cell division protein FtsZ [Bacteroidaceae bacterium]|nr:cell division protein FtsZ [Bacteroidaceae bacterium]